MKLEYTRSLARPGLIAAICIACLSLPVRAEFIQPVAVMANNGEATQETLINGEGLDNPGAGSPEALHSRDNGQMWSVVGSIKADVVFDLGQTVDLTKVYIWNYNVADATDVGMRDIEVLVSPDTNMTNANFTAIALISLQEGGDTGQVFQVIGTNVRLVKLKGISNWGHGWSCGLAEARFESGPIDGNVPGIVVSNPHEGDVLSYSTNMVVNVEAKVTDLDGAADILKVEFYDGSTKLGEKGAAPFTWPVKAPATGEHAFRVVATDKGGKTGWVTVNVTVREFVADRIDQIDDTADEGTGFNQITYSSGWNLAQGNASDPRFKNNDHYTQTRNSYYEVRFVGVKIEVFGTVASHHGTGIATIDGGMTNTVNYKSGQRKEQVLVYSSPLLANKEHVLRVRATGDGVITADRFDVHVSLKPAVDRAFIKSVSADPSSLVVHLEDAGSSVVDPVSVKLTVDNAAASAKVVKAGSITTVTHQPPATFQPGSTHELLLVANDGTGTPLTNQASFTLPAPFFPVTGLGGPASIAGKWGFRQIWSAGRVDALSAAVSVAMRANQAGFTGKVSDTSVSFINFAKTANPGTGGLIPDDQPLPAEPTGLSENDFVLVARATVKIPRAGDWTIGVHSDEGFGLRFIGAPFDSVNGNGQQDENYPEYMANPVNTTDSATRGVLRNLPAGQYEIEFISWERVGSAYYEVYAAEGAFEDDSATDQWQLIGAPGGLEIVPGIKLSLQSIARLADKVSIDFTTPNAGGQHVLEQTLDFKSWQTVPAAAFEKRSDSVVRVFVPGVAEPAAFYRVGLKP
jgi:hypothetical protein